VTPAADYWLEDINHAARQAIVQTPPDAASVAHAWVGIVTLWDMADCLGWPRREIGFADIVKLRLGDMPWACATPRPEWASPRLVFTTPRSSTTGRGVLATLLAISTQKAPEQVTLDDVRSPAVTEGIKTFKRAIDHYEPDTLMLNKYILEHQVGHFYFIAEDNLVKLYTGKIKDDQGGYLPRLQRQLVMIYPSKGATVHTSAAAIALGDWVTPEQHEAARRWVAFLREDAQQRTFMEWGFRPGTDLPLGCPVCPSYGITPKPPAEVINFQEGVRYAMIDAWENEPGPMAVSLD
jgi:Ca-activated chloride channel family protein